MNKDSSGKIGDIINAKPLLILGDSITTDHISPAGNISKSSPAAKFLQENGVSMQDFNSYGARRGSHSVMMRGTFANIRIKNEMAVENGILKEGGYSKNFTTGEVLPVYDVAMHHKQNGTPMVVIAGKEYGTGSSRDWAAKGTYLLGVKAVIAESFERIHRSNLVGMGVLPFVFMNGESRKTLNLKGDEVISIKNLQNLTPSQEVQAEIEYSDGTKKEIKILSKVNTNPELEYIKNGGIMHFVIRNTALNLEEFECKTNYKAKDKTNCQSKCECKHWNMIKELFDKIFCCKSAKCCEK